MADHVSLTSAYFPGTVQYLFDSAVARRTR